MSTAIAARQTAHQTARQTAHQTVTVDVSNIDSHMRALGLFSKSSYMLWCRRHGFSMDIDKTRAERLSELRWLQQQNEPDDPQADACHDPRRAEVIERIAAGELKGQFLSEPMIRVPGLFVDINHVSGGRTALLDLLLHVEKYGRLLICVPGACRGQSQRNLVISGLSQLALNHSRWIRPVQDWRPTRRKPLDQFIDLATHLLAHYPVPRSLNAGWFEEDEQERSIQQGWYLHVAAGNNIRTASDLPFKLSKRAAHLFMNASHGNNPLQALRHAQIHAIDDRIRASLGWSVSGHERVWARDNADFWTSILHFFVNNPMLEGSYIWPVIDYVHYTKFEERRIPQPDGSVQIAPPAHPKFCLKSRSINKLVREVDNWHEQLSAVEYGHVQAWSPSGFAGLQRTEDNDRLAARIQWSIQELCTSALLQVEGRMMHHCVGSYTRRCLTGEMSIWSLRARKDEEDAEDHHVLTIAVDNNKRQITQARGKFNLQPHGSRMNKRQQRMDSNYRVALRESARIMALWRTQEGLSYTEN
jgi:hypothetical protein